MVFKYDNHDKNVENEIFIHNINEKTILLVKSIKVLALSVYILRKLKNLFKILDFSLYTPEWVLGACFFIICLKEILKFEKFKTFYVLIFYFFILLRI